MKVILIVLFAMGSLTAYANYFECKVDYKVLGDKVVYKAKLVNLKSRVQKEFVSSSIEMIAKNRCLDYFDNNINGDVRCEVGYRRYEDIYIAKALNANGTTLEWFPSSSKEEETLDKCLVYIGL